MQNVPAVKTLESPWYLLRVINESESGQYHYSLPVYPQCLAQRLAPTRCSVNIVRSSSVQVLPKEKKMGKLRKLDGDLDGVWGEIPSIQGIEPNLTGAKEKVYLS